MTIPYRHQEVLQALHDNPKGLTAAQIFATAKKRTGSELPNAETVSKLIYVLRNGTPKLVTTSDAVGGNIHKITDAGREALKAALEEQGEILNQAADKFIADMTETTLSNQQIEQLTDCDNQDNAETSEPSTSTINSAADDFEIIDFDMTDTLDKALHGLVHLIRNCAEQTSVAIERKSEKLSVLEQLESTTLLSGECRALLASIRIDLAQLDEAA